VHQLYGLLGSAVAEESSDEQLLERYVTRRDEGAFGCLLKRYGGMVLHVCRRVLHHPQDAEDAFQATFLLLARNAKSIRKREAVASWLYGVAYRLAVKTKTRNARRQAKEKQAVSKPQADVGLEAAWRELQAVLDEELHRLPVKYQAPLVLCYLEGKTHEEAARQLGWPLGTVRGRVARAREVLKSRLARRGLALPAAALATVLAANVARAVPAKLFGATWKAALASAAGGQAPAGLVTAEAVALAEGGLTAMTATHLKLGLALFLALGVATAGAGTLAAIGMGKAPAAPTAKDEARGKEGDKVERRDTYGDLLPSGASARLGSARFWAGAVYVPNYTLTFTPDGQRLAMAGNRGAIYLWDAETGKEVARIGGEKQPGLIVHNLAFSRDGKLLAVAENDRGIRVWDVKKTKEVVFLATEKKGDWFHDCVFAPDGKVLASPGQTGSIHRWEVPSGKKLPSFAGHKGAVNVVAFSKDGRHLLSGGDDQTVRLWDAATGKNVRTLEGHRDKIVAVALSPDGKTAASRGSDESIRLWEIESGKEIRSWEQPTQFWTRGMGNVSAIAFSADGKTLTAGNYNLTCAFDVATGERVRQFLRTGYAVVSPDGKRMATGGYGQRIRTWNAVTNKELYRPVGHQGSVLAVALSPDGKIVATGGLDKTVRLWDRATGKELRQLRGHSGSVSFLRFAADGKHLASASGDPKDRSVTWWNVTAGKEERLFHRHDGGVQALALAADGKHLTALDKTATLHVWDTGTGKEVRKIKGQQTFNAAITPDGKTIVLLAGQPPQLQTWDPTGDGTLRALDGPEGTGVARMAFSPDGRSMITADYLRALRLWDLASAKAVRSLREGSAEARLNPGAGGDILAFSPDGKTLAVPAPEGAVALIEVATGKDRHVFQGKQESITSLAFSADGATLISGGEDGTTLVWDVNDAGQAAKAELTPKELDALWTELAGEDAIKAHRAIRSLAASPSLAVRFLRKQLQPANEVEQKRIEKLIADLSQDTFAVRKKAEEELAKLGIQAKPALLKALKAKPSLDVTQRLENLLRALDDRQLSAEEVRLIRALEALEAIGTDEAKQLFQDWTKGAAGALLTEEAKASLARMARQSR
jgi:RNA polymerase sigma factor (sigma-70 family)